MSKVQLNGILKLVDVKVNPQVFRKISQAVAGMPPPLVKVNQHLKQASRHSKKLTKNLQGTGKQLKNNERAARLFLQRMAQFAILLPTFATLNRAIQGSVKFLFEFDSALRDIVRIDITGLRDRMEEVGDAALKTAVDFGVTATEVLGVTRIFKQAGFTIEESQSKAQAAILATQVSTLNSAQAVEVFIAAQKQFGKEGENAISVLDKLAKVEDAAAVNASDVAEAFRTGGNALAEFSKSIDDSVGVIAALREQSRKSGREIGTFLKTIQTRIFAAGEARDAVEALGVEVENLDGSLRPTLEVLNDLKLRFDSLTEAQASNAAKSIAGIRQFESLLATLNSLDRANELAAESSEAAGTAAEKRLVTDEKLERQLGKLIAQGQEFAEALGDSGLEDALASALKSATLLLNIFTGLVSTIGDLGGNLAPLLALSGVQLGRSVFGVVRGGQPGGGGGGPAPGQASFIGPLNKMQKEIGTAGQDLKRLRNAFSSTGKLVGSWGAQIATGTKISKQHGVQLLSDTQALKTHAQAIKTNIVAVKQSAGAAVKQGKVFQSTGAGLAGLAVIAGVLPSVFESLEGSASSLDGVVGQAAGTFVGVVGQGASMAAQFAFLGGKAAGVAGVAGLLIESFTRVSDAAKEQAKALEELTEFRKRKDDITTGEALLLGEGRAGQEVQSEFFANLAKNVKGADFGSELVKAIQQTFDQTVDLKVVKDLGIASDVLTESLFNNINVIRGLVDAREGSIRAIAEENDRLREFEQLQEGLADGTLSAGNAFGLFVKSLGAGIVEINEATQTLKRSLNFEEFKKAQEITNLADGIRTLNLELQLAQAGPDALADSVVRLQNELLIAERESENTLRSLQQRTGSLVGDLQNSFTVGLNKEADSVAVFFNKIKEGVTTLDDADIQDFNRAIEQLPDTQQKAAKEILKIVEAQILEETKIQEKRNALQAELSARSQAALDAEERAAKNAFEATEKLSAKLSEFGQSVNKNVLNAFQGVQLGDVESVLAGTSNLDSGIQELITNAFGDPVTKAQNELQAVTSQTESELRILASELERVEDALKDQANAADFASLLSEKLGLELSMQTVKQEGAINSTKAKIKVLEAEREAAEEAAEAEQKRIELLEKLADASRAFDKELKDINRSFQDFQENKINELLKEEASARSNLKEAQQNVLDSTASLAEAYQGLIQAQLQYNGAIAEAKINNNLLARDIAKLTGELVTFDQGLASLGDSFRSVLNESNIDLEKRIDLERQLAEETLSFLQQARDEIVQAGLGVFGQTAAENQALNEGIAGLQFVADQLGGSFENFLSLGGGELASVSERLLGLPAEFRQQILDALSFLPSTANIGGFSVEQLTQAIGQIGAGVAPEAGLPSIEELNNKQVEQLTRLQDLAIQDAQLQFNQVAAAREQVALAQEALDAALIQEERATENLQAVREAVIEEKAVLDAANEQRQQLLSAVIAADDKNTLRQIERQAQLFAEQNSTFRDVGDNIVRGLASAINARLAVIEASQQVTTAFAGHIPNFDSGNLSPSEAAALLRAGSREKSAMPPGAGLAVANTSEAIIPMHANGYIPNFQSGSEISAGISAIKGINETVVAAISRSVTQALADLQTGQEQTPELLQEVISQLSSLNDISDEISSSNSAVVANTTPTESTDGGTQATGSQRVEISLQTNQQNTVSITGLENLRGEIEAAIAESTAQQVDAQVTELLEQLDGVVAALQERGIVSSFGQAR